MPKAKYYVRPPAEPTPTEPFDPPVNRGPNPGPPQLKFIGVSWQYYYRRRWRSLKLPRHMHAEAERRFAVIRARIDAGRDPVHRPGDKLFKDVIRQRIAWLEVTATTPAQFTELQRANSDAVWWLQYFGKLKLKAYRAKDSDEYLAWYVEQRSAFYLAHPWSRKEAANGAVTSLQSLKKFLKRWAQDEETGWCPNIKIPKKVPVRAGRVLERWEQARLLLACLGYVWDHDTQDWKKNCYVDENGEERWTYRVRSKKHVLRRKGLARIIRVGIRTAAREEVYSEVVWGRHKAYAHFDVDGDGRGKFRRRGTRVPDTNKTRPTSPVARRLRILLWIWQYEDGHTFRMIGDGENRRKHYRGNKQTWVFRKIDEQPYATVDLSGVVKDAGLGPEVTEHALRFTAVDEAHRQGYALEDAVRILGMSAENLLGHYTDWGRRRDAPEEETLRAVDSLAMAKLLRKPQGKADPSARKRKRLKNAERTARKRDARGSQLQAAE